METYPLEAWRRLGSLLKRRRPQLNQRYRIRKVFAAEVGIADKTIQDIENGYRQNFTEEMLSAVEAAYRIAPGSIEKALRDPGLAEFPDRVGEATISQGRAETAPSLAVVPDIQIGRDGDPDPLDAEIVLYGNEVWRLEGLRDQVELRFWMMTDLVWQDRAAAIVGIRRAKGEQPTYRNGADHRPASRVRREPRADNG